jgi:glycosyltransferase involved in cell wall biosynthesis
MDIHIFILCYNEQDLLPHTINHYKSHLPSCNITILDNESTDNSVQIAIDLGCNIVSWTSNYKNQIDDIQYKDLKNNCWKSIQSGWIIACDMDEWLCITEEDLRNEYNSGTSILNVRGINMISDNLSDNVNEIDLFGIRNYMNHPPEDKKLCFLREKVQEMNYDMGAHNCNPIGQIQYSTKTYYNKHMEYLGLDFYTNKMINRYNRAYEMQKIGLATHYTNNIDEIQNRYMDILTNSSILESESPY